MSELSGSQLRAIREEKHIPLEQVASATRIRLSLLQALEMDEYAELGSRTQARGFLKLYADFLGVPFESPQKTPASAPDTTANLPKSPEAGSVSASRPTIQAAPQPDKKANKLTLHSPQPGKQSKKSKEKPAPTLSPSSPSQQILDEIGRELQNRRKYLDIPWDLLSEQTRIPKKQLVALEQGMLDTFASPSEAKGCANLRPLSKPGYRFRFNPFRGRAERNWKSRRRLERKGRSPRPASLFAGFAAVFHIGSLFWDPFGGRHSHFLNLGRRRPVEQTRPKRRINPAPGDG